jgi:thiol-disulfide isomerase/thioredoxin
MLLERDDSWHLGASPPNVNSATSPRHAKDLILNARPGRLIVLDFYAPSCLGCRSLWPKLKQIAEANPDVLVVTVDTSQRALGDMAAKLGADRLPYFQLLQGGTGEMIASFTANLSTVSRLRAEIVGHARAQAGCASPR